MVFCFLCFAVRGSGVESSEVAEAAAEPPQPVRGMGSGMGGVWLDRLTREAVRSDASSSFLNSLADVRRALEWWEAETGGEGRSPQSCAACSAALFLFSERSGVWSAPVGSCGLLCVSEMGGGTLGLGVLEGVVGAAVGFRFITPGCADEVGAVSSFSVGESLLGATYLGAVGLGELVGGGVVGGGDLAFFLSCSFEKGSVSEGFGLRARAGVWISAGSAELPQGSEGVERAGDSILPTRMSEFPGEEPGCRAREELFDRGLLKPSPTAGRITCRILPGFL